MNKDMLGILTNIQELKEKMNDSADKVDLFEVGLKKWRNSQYFLAKRELELYMRSLRLEDIKCIIILLELGQGGYIEEASNEDIYKALKYDMKTITEKEIQEKIEDMVVNSQLWNRIECGLNILADLENKNS